jgi:phospholipid/cholesterol/gamma-HCH transport system substrate-binding protein
MKDQRKTEIKVGITVVAGIIIFLWIIGWAKNYSLTAKQKYLMLEFPTVSGLEIGDNVTINGVRKGFVEEIETKNNAVFVKTAFDNNIDLREDATFAITMMDLMGAKKIEITPGKANKELDYSKVYQGQYYTDIPAAMALIGKIQDDLVGIIKNVQKTLGSINKYLGDEKLNKEIKTSVENLSEISQKLNLILDENRSNVKQLTKNSVDLTNETKGFIKDNKEDVHNSIELVKSSLKKTDELITKLNTLIDETNAQKNNAGKLLNNEALYNDVTATLKQVKDLTKILNDQLNGKGLNVDAKIKIF